MKQVNSSNIELIQYSGTTMTVTFRGGGTYDYDDVPAELFDRFIESDSLGKFFHDEVRGKFNNRKHEPPEEKAPASDLMQQLRDSIEKETSEPSKEI